MSISKQFDQAVAAQLPATLRSVVSDRTTIADLRALIVTSPQVADLSLGTLVSGAKPKAGKAPSKKPKTDRPSKTAVNTRTEAGRNALDAHVLAVMNELGGETIAASSIKVGATPAQLRTSLNRLIEADRVEYTGKARGTRYSLVK